MVRGHEAIHDRNVMEVSSGSWGLCGTIDKATVSKILENGSTGTLGTAGMEGKPAQAQLAGPSDTGSSGHNQPERRTERGSQL